MSFFSTQPNRNQGRNSYQVDINGANVSYRFRGRISEEVQKEMWNVYQSRINERIENENLDLELGLINLKKIFGLTKSFEVLGKIEDNSKGYLMTAKILKTAVRLRFLSIIQRNKSFIINNNCFNQKLDHAERVTTRIFIKLFELYFEQREYDKAFEAVEMIKLTKQGSEALLTLAAIYLKECDPKIFMTLEAFQENYPSKEAIEEFLNQIENGNKEKLDNLVGALKKIQNEKLKSIIIPPLVFKLLKEDNVGAIDLVKYIIDTDIQKQIYVEVVDFYLTRKNIQNALPIISIINDDYEKKQIYIKITNLYIEQKEIQKALEIVSNINDYYRKKQLYIRIVKAFIEENDIQNALSIILKINDDYEKKQFYIKIVELYIEQKNAEKALEIILNINDDGLKKQFYIKIVELYIEQNNPQKALEITSKINNDYEQKECYSKVIVYCLANEEDQQTKNLSFELLSSN